MCEFLVINDSHTDVESFKPIDADMIYYTELEEANSQNALRAFSIKYVAEGYINYHIDKQVYTVNSSQYLTACNRSQASADFRWSRPVKSMCIDISSATMDEVFSVITDKGDRFDDYLSGYFRSPSFFESIHGAEASKLGFLLDETFKKIARRDKIDFCSEFFSSVAEQMVYQEYGNFLALNTLQYKKVSTRKEILRRLHVGLQYIKEHYLTITGVREVAAYCSMSEYHFFRCFRQVYHMSPSKYITQKKMLYAKHLLETGDKMIADVATECNYSDIFTFSKAFKKYYGCSPIQLKRRKMPYSVLAGNF